MSCPLWQCQGRCSLYEGIPSFGNVISKKCLVLKKFAVKCLFIMRCFFIQVLKFVNLSILGFHHQSINWLNSWRSICCLGDGLRNTQHQSILSWCFSYWLKLSQSCLVKCGLKVCRKYLPIQSTLVECGLKVCHGHSMQSLVEVVGCRLKVCHGHSTLHSFLICSPHQCFLEMMEKQRWTHEERYLFDYKSFHGPSMTLN